jgi:acetolactate synthase regulatory subunit
MQFNRNIFTDTKPSTLERVLDVLLAVAIGICLTMALLHACDALFA